MLDCAGAYCSEIKLEGRTSPGMESLSHTHIRASTGCSCTLYNTRECESSNGYSGHGRRVALDLPPFEFLTCNAPFFFLRASVYAVHAFSSLVAATRSQTASGVAPAPAVYAKSYGTYSMLKVARRCALLYAIPRPAMHARRRSYMSDASDAEFVCSVPPADLLVHTRNSTLRRWPYLPGRTDTPPSCRARIS